MTEIRNLLKSTAGDSEFAHDLAEWLSPPRKPVFKVSRRQRTGARNGFGFGLVTVVVLLGGYFAFTGALPSLGFLLGALVIGLSLALRTWFVETRLAREDDAVRMESHRARYRAYLRRKRIWERLIHCASCGAVTDRVTQRTTTLYEVHELVNTH
jgi:hypothetical protein